MKWQNSNNMLFPVPTLSCVQVCNHSWVFFGASNIGTHLVYLFAFFKSVHWATVHESIRQAPLGFPLTYKDTCFIRNHTCSKRKLWMMHMDWKICSILDRIKPSCPSWLNQICPSFIKDVKFSSRPILKPHLPTHVNLTYSKVIQLRWLQYIKFVCNRFSFMTFIIFKWKVDERRWSTRLHKW